MEWPYQRTEGVRHEMAKSKYKSWDELRRVRFSEEEIAQIDRAAAKELLKLDLRAIRKLAGKTQAEVAKAMNGNQGDISKLEAGTDYRLSTLRRFVAAVGGELEVVARIGNKSIVLSV